LLTSLTFQNFSFFSLQRTTQKNNALKEFVMLQSGNNHKEKKSTLDVQEQKQCILKIDAGGKNFIIFDSPNLELFVVELLKKASAQQRQYHLSEDLLQVCQKVLDKQKKFSLQEIAKALPEMLSFALAKIEETISCLRVIILFINIFLFFPLQSTPWIKSPITQKIPMEYYNNTAGKKRTLSVQEQKQPAMLQTDDGKNTIIIDNQDLEKFVVELLDKASAEGKQYSLSEELLIVCQKIFNNHKEFLPEEIAKALPELLEFASAKIQETKAPRLDAPGSQDGSIVGSSVACNLDEVIQLLNQLTAIIIQCCNTLQLDFAGTFTVLNALIVEFNGTFTVLDTLINTATIDFNGTFTAFADIKNTLTIDFNGTFTALQSCCNQIFIDFTNVFTTLTDIKNTLTVEFNGTFTELFTDISILTRDFSGTFTALQACCES
jgi:uncharacterized membrane protein YsdA (DUF1294 family)